MPMANNYAPSSLNVATPILGLVGATSQSVVSVAAPKTLGHGGMTSRSAVNVATPTLGLDGVTSQSAVSVATPKTLGHSGVTYQSDVNLAKSTLWHGNVTQNNPIQNQMGYYTNGGLTGGANNYLFPSTNYIAPSSGTTPIHDNFIFEQPFNGGLQGSNTDLFSANNFNADFQVTNV